MVPVRKKDDSIRLCVDYRELNRITPLRRFWLPSLQEILDRVGVSAVLSKLDLTSGFHQIRMDEGSQELTSFCCPAGRYMFVRMPFGRKMRQPFSSLFWRMCCVLFRMYVPITSMMS